MQAKIQTFDRNWWDNFWNDANSPAKRKYREFEEKYFGDEIIISFGENYQTGKPGVIDL